jgi:hypothetical protein
MPWRVDLSSTLCAVQAYEGTQEPEQACCTHPADLCCAVQAAKIAEDPQRGYVFASLQVHDTVRTQDAAVQCNTVLQYRGDILLGDCNQSKL